MSATGNEAVKLSQLKGTIKPMQEQIANLQQRGRYLALWDCTTGLPTSYPTPSSYPYTYEYKTGDYFIVTNVGASNNKKPSGTSISKASASADWVIGSASESENVKVNDTYYFNGTTWSLQKNTQDISTLVTDVTYGADNYLKQTKNGQSTNITKVVTSVNGSSGAISNIATTSDIPTSVSELTNDSGYITSSVDNLTNYTKTSELSDVATSGSYNDLTNKPTIPSNYVIAGGTKTTSATTQINSSVPNTFTLKRTQSNGGVFIDYKYANQDTNYARVGAFSNGDFGVCNDSQDATSLKITRERTIKKDNTYTYTLPNATGTIALTSNLPTKTSQLTNDSGFITNASVPTTTSQLTNDSGFITNSVDDLTNYTLSTDLSSVATSGNYNDLTNKPTIPSAVTESTVSGWGFTKNTGTVSSLSDLGITATASELNVLDGITATTTELNYTDGVTSNIQTQLNGKQATITSSNKLSTSLISGLSNVATSGSYNDLSNTPTIPSVSDATITINQGGTQKGTFTLNGSATTINLDAGGSIPNNIATYQGQSSGCVISWSGENTAPDWVLTTTDADAGNTNKYCSIANLKATMGVPTFSYDSSTYTLTITP